MVFLAVVAGSLQLQQNPLFFPPRGSRCWGSCNGLLSLRVAARTGLTLCPNCGLSYSLPEVDENIDLNNFCETRQLVCTFPANHPATTWWTKLGDEQHWTGFNHGFGVSPKSIYWDNEENAACIASAPSSLIVDTVFEQRVLPTSDELQQELDDLGIELEYPAAHVIHIILEEDPLLELWNKRGHHVFRVEEDIYMCILLRNTENNSIHARLYVLNVDEEASMIPAGDIGNNALFLGANQAFVQLPIRICFPILLMWLTMTVQFEPPR
ncbi:uncharacterized protein LOC119334325 [Triticum dicoccoides]|uniref:uncharacterized protein LOC119334325 n=1 Tax=Triticum dicoccoides TaxID=85692 RepID=UPI001891E397|nr:uncharacterized protein LOC119334325 [Triticum dicoccoides]